MLSLFFVTILKKSAYYIPAPIKDVNLFVVVLIALPEVASFPASMSLASLVFFNFVLNLARCRSDMGPPALKR